MYNIMYLYKRCVCNNKTHTISERKRINEIIKKHHCTVHFATAIIID